MTSPAQLKYLDAMGIPVWVSRDLIIEDNISLNSASSTTLDNTSVPSNNNPVSVKPSLDSTNKNNNSAQSILNSLESDSTGNVRNNTQADDTPKNDSQSEEVTSNEGINTAIEHAVSDSSLSSSTAQLSSSPSDALNNQNLLLQSPEHFVYACGDKEADWLIIGHSPEPFSGIGQEPFAGEAGQLLENMLRAVGINNPRTQSYMINIVDKNQSVDTNEATQAAFKQDLLDVIDNVKPKIVLFMGQIAPQNLLGISDPLIIMRSKVHKITATEIPCVVTYYPNYLLQKPIDKRKAWDDLKLAMRQLN